MIFTLQNVQGKLLTNLRVNKLLHTIYWKCNFSYGYVKLYDLDITTEKLLTI